MLKIRVFFFLGTLLSTAGLLASGEAYTQIYPDDGVKIGKVKYISSELKSNYQLAKTIKDKEFKGTCPAGFKRTYLYNKIDLNADGKPEIIAYVMGDCGGTGGYPLLVLGKKGNSYKVISETIAVRQPIIVSSTQTKGWRDIIVSAAGNSKEVTTALSHYVILKWKGASYPKGTNAPPAVSLKPGEVINGDVIVAEPVHQPGAILPAINLE